jgi:hypothetical protein
MLGSGQSCTPRVAWGAGGVNQVSIQSWTMSNASGLVKGAWMSVRLFITIDVEEDAWGVYEEKIPTVNNVTRIPILQSLFNRFGAIPTYLVNYPVVKDEPSRNILLEIFNKGQSEIGAHCHPWNTPPFDEEINITNSMLFNLSNELIYEKVKTLHDEIINRFDLLPISFRAGRSGFGPNVARCISQLGYRIDSSVLPFCDLRDTKGPDFSDAPTSPYWFRADERSGKNGGGMILEVPPSTGFFQKNFQAAARFRRWISSAPIQFHLLGVLDRLHLINFHSLEPELNSGPDMIRLAQTLIATGHSFLNMCFHSTSLLPGHSPFVRNDDELKGFLNKIEAFLKFASENGIVFLPLKAALEDGSSFTTDAGG